jgi:hAT family C-terminal dimerisation region
MINADYINNMLNLLKRYTPSEKHIEIVEDFFVFRDYEGKFARWRDCWKKEYREKPILFWKIVAGEASYLSALAIQVFSTPANSVPSERSFSAINFIQDEYRSHLSAEKTNMLIFIYMNSKVLRQQPSEPASTWYNLTEDQEEEFEDLAFKYICRFENTDNL